jgi:hypothetical protein
MSRALLSTLLCLSVAAPAVAQSPDSGKPQPATIQPPSRPAPKVGVQVNEPDAFQGYTLIAPLQSTKTYLVDTKGRVVHTWESKYTAGQDAYLLENGHLLRAANLGENEAFFAGASQGGRIQEFAWDGELVWDYKFHNEKQIRHHSITRMPNGNVLMNVWERKTPADFIAAGLKSDLAGTSDVLVDAIYEVQPSGKTGGKIVWEWHIWDHLIQDLDATKANFADVAAHPERADLNFYELIDVNFARTGGPAFGNLARFAGPTPNQNDSKKDDAKESDGTKVDGKKPDGKKDNSLDRLKALGYVGAAGGRKFAGFLPDWTHCNSVAYNAKLDQVMVSCREFSEIWIIDHSTTSAEAASHRGGHHGKGGDLLYRWGNPQTYRAGTSKDQRLFNQHDASWIPDGLPGAGHMLVFNNGSRRPDGNYSSADEIVPPVDENGHYERKSGAAFGPKAAAWSYSAPDQEQFFAPFMGGAQRLENGDTLMSTGFGGVVFEVTPQKKIVWRYINPAKATGGMGVPGAFGGAGGPGGGPGGGPRFTPPPPNTHPIQLLPGFLPFALQLTPEQRKQVDEFETDASGRFEKSLNDHERDQLKELQKNAGPFGFAGPPDLDHVLAKAIHDKLDLSADQIKLVDELQKQGEAKLKDLLKDDQKNQLKTMKDMMKAFAGGPPGGGRPGGPGGPGGGPGGFGFGGGGDFAGGSGIFRAYRYSPDFAGLKSRDLKPGKTIEELEAKPKEVSMK